MPYYAVGAGHTTGVFTTWTECKESIHGFSGAKYKKFDTKKEAEDFIAKYSYTETLKEDTQSTENTNRPTFTPDYYVYTDGSCVGNGKSSAKAGVGIYFGENDSRNVSRLAHGKQSNNTAEVQAIIGVYPIIKDDIVSGKKIAIVSDSEYAIKCVTHYGERMHKTGWKQDIPNKELVKELYDTYCNIPNVQFIHIMAHTNNTDVHSIGNAGADLLANLAIGHTSCPYASTKIYLNVPFPKKEEAKSLGAKWDVSRKKWYTTESNANTAKLLEEFS